MFFMLLILSVIGAGLFIYLVLEEYSIASALAFIATMFLLLATSFVHFDNVAFSKVEALKSVGIEPLSNSQVYEMSRKELNKCKTVYTFNGVYYFMVEEE